MSLVPKSNDVDPWESRRPRWFDWDSFGLGITPQEIQSFFEFPRLKFDNFFKQFGDLTPVTFGKDGFQAVFDVKQFTPNEITVKTVDNNVVIEGKHEERKDDHGFVSRHFVRKYALPRGYDASQVVSSLSSDGVLTVKAPPPQGPIESNERIVQIEHTGPSNLNIKHNQKEEPKKKKK